mmetsp:Transcript_49151/g.100327  ORF Transcript_49151/g.100327 Transcript_49151/m.100327 type:complete len:204 (-) Transcript_49151:175-786(-)|eukprot:CAMPEP_0181325508 /NCGR_PEP_ID=MMETSP1101-20121128/20970_1 /TAXON_ID=46948 /ORGANISM="Rhodomonas abbreviata, Strain Caron Lab Isolate" /LENGTH=203 /DNA_ID=CAMNT_0023433835 /DNA_START=120 /DNA_END=731 /DNA_ORIENTATION=-
MVLFQPSMTAAMNALNVVFVYGTLKRGLYNSKYLQTAGATLLGKAKTSTELPMITDEYYVPYLLKAPGVGNKIQGELYAVNDEVLHKLDELEGVPTYYTRERVPVEQLELVGASEKHGKKLMESLDLCMPWVYMMPEHRVTEEHMANEYMANYKPCEHFKNYVPRSHRAKTHVSMTLKQNNLVHTSWDIPPLSAAKSSHFVSM